MPIQLNQWYRWGFTGCCLIPIRHLGILGYKCLACTNSGTPIQFAVRSGIELCGLARYDAPVTLIILEAAKIVISPTHRFVQGFPGFIGSPLYDD